jgi:hypothetical protein
METSAYLLIRASEAVRQSGYLEALEELWALPEVEYVEPVTNLYDCVIRVEAPTIRLTPLVHEVMAKGWVEDVHVLRVDQPAERAPEWEEARMAKLRRQRQIIRAYRTCLQRAPLSAQQPYVGRAAAIRMELEEARSLSRQLEIVKAHYHKRRTSTAPARHR